MFFTSKYTKQAKHEKTSPLNQHCMGIAQAKMFAMFNDNDFINVREYLSNFESPLR